MKNQCVLRMNKYDQVCVWEATIVGNKVAEFTEFMKEEFGIRIQYLEEIKTNPDQTKFLTSVEGTGNRNDIFFAVHEDDVMKFTTSRLNYGIRWIEDVLSKCNYHSPIYPNRVHDYCTWNTEDATNLGV